MALSRSLRDPVYCPLLTTLSNGQFADLLRLGRHHFHNHDYANADNQPKYVAKKDSEVPEDHANVVVAIAESGEEGISNGPFEGESGQAAIDLQVADHRIDTLVPNLI